jgi:RNA polymerase sigma-70 factor (ECF subfamily)
MQDARFRALVDEHFDFIWRCLRRFGVPQSEVDAAAERVFVFAARRLDAVVGGSERAFLLDAAIRVAAAERQRPRRKPSMTSEGADEATRPSDNAALERARPVAQEIFDSMSIEHCVVLVLSEIEELPARTIAGLLDLPEAAVRARLETARGRLRDGARVTLRVWANG